MRAFVAIDLPPLEDPVPTGLKPEDHLTLHFFEELPEERVPAVVEAIQESTQDCVPFPLEFRGVGAFPNPARPRVIWAGVAEGAAALQRLADRLRQALSTRGFSTPHRPFVPHRTLARVRSPREAVWAIGLLSDPELSTRTWTRTTVSEVLLKQSELTPAGARHTIRERLRLEGPPGRST